MSRLVSREATFIPFFADFRYKSGLSGVLSREGTSEVPGYKTILVLGNSACTFGAPMRSNLYLVSTERSRAAIFVPKTGEKRSKNGRSIIWAALVVALFH